MKKIINMLTCALLSLFILAGCSAKTKEPATSVSSTEAAGEYNNIGKSLNELMAEHPNMVFDTVYIANADGCVVTEKGSPYSYYFYGTQYAAFEPLYTKGYGDRLKCAGIASSIGYIFPQAEDGALIPDFCASIGVSDYKIYTAISGNTLCFSYNGLSVSINWLDNNYDSSHEEDANADAYYTDYYKANYHIGKSSPVIIYNGTIAAENEAIIDQVADSVYS
ncbi:MAG: hypothetical protein LBS74_09275 [Oscillospiraceae bacterium]|jgi:hypothetical protein|nr:hypothetical protein [Oscillospiraceae bacterium]